jgi:hypothetical protein
MSTLEFWETMSGAYHFVDKPHEERPMSFTIRARSAPLWRFLRHPEVEIEGEVFAPGLANHRHVRGTLGLDVLRTRTLPYRFKFVGDDGRAYEFQGQKDVSPLALLETMTTLPGSIRDENGVHVAVALLRFDARSDLSKFLKSFRLAPI